MNLGLLKLFLIIIIFSSNLIAEPLQKKYANFKLLDKISNKITKIVIGVDNSIIVEALNISVYSCFTEPPDKIPENYVLIDVIENYSNKEKSIYKGWMISSSPEITPLEHPIYDLWLIGCSNDNTS